MLLLELYVFVLAAFVGYMIISRVPALLHTPLMAATNAISGISLVGSLIAAGAAHNRVATILGFIFSWNNFVFGIVLAGRETRTLPVAVYNMISFDQLSWGPLAAAALLVTFPVLLLTITAQRQIVAGLTAGAVKGG